MKDRWCEKLTLPNGTVVSGAAAREARIAAAGGMEAVLTEMFERVTALASQTTPKGNVVSLKDSKKRRRKSA